MIRVPSASVFIRCADTWIAAMLLSLCRIGTPSTLSGADCRRRKPPSPVGNPLADCPMQCMVVSSSTAQFSGAAFAATPGSAAATSIAGAGRVRSQIAPYAARCALMSLRPVSLGSFCTRSPISSRATYPGNHAARADRVARRDPWPVNLTVSDQRSLAPSPTPPPS